MPASLSVIICTHDPLPDLLQRVLEALKIQTLSKDQWELLLIDNASTVPLSGKCDLSWHPLARYAREGELGLTSARLRGIKESASPLLVFVDDDNVLDSDYLEQALSIGKKWAVLGAWGGSIVPWYETEPPAWSKPYLRYLALREVKEDRWSNYCDYPGLMPWGAGMCVRRSVADEYVRRLKGDATRRALDRRGELLGSCGDSDLVMVACDLGLGTGLFRVLRLTHLIPAKRLQESYLLPLIENMTYSLTILRALRGLRPKSPSWLRLLWRHIPALRRGLREFRFYCALRRGTRAAVKEIASRNLAAASRINPSNQTDCVKRIEGAEAL